jgi:hypothetical protein
VGETATFPLSTQIVGANNHSPLLDRVASLTLASPHPDPLPQGERESCYISSFLATGRGSSGTSVFSGSSLRSRMTRESSFSDVGRARRYRVSFQVRWGGASPSPRPSPARGEGEYGNSSRLRDFKSQKNNSLFFIVM